MDVVLKFLLSTCWYTHRSVHLLAAIRETSLCSDGGQSRVLQWVTAQRTRYCKELNPKFDCTTPPPKAKGTTCMNGWEVIRARGSGGVYKTDCVSDIEVSLHTEAHSCYNRRSSQQNVPASMGNRGGHDIPPIAEELLATDPCWCRESRLSLEMASHRLPKLK